MNEIEAILPLVAIVGAFGVPALAIILHYRHQHRRRELEHIERIKAFEMGRTLPQDEPAPSPSPSPSPAPAKIGASIAISVPIVSFVAATLSLADGFHEPIWIAACMVGTAAVICGSILVMSASKKDAPSSAPAVDKPYVEEDAYDVVSSRG